MALPKAEIGIFGGSGFYEFLEGMEEVEVETPFGRPSDKVMVGEYAGRRIAFIPRHGKGHRWPPHKVNWRANVYAMKMLGVERIIGPSAVGSLQPHIHPGDIVVCDQFVDRTWGRGVTYYDGVLTTHVSPADPYCPQLRRLALEVAEKLGITVHDGGTIVVVQGPRFSTKAESEWFTKMGWSVVGMTQYPEAFLARELGICYVNLSLVTDYDVGLVAGGEVEPVSAEVIRRTFERNVGKARRLILAMIESMPKERTCDCARALEGARF